MTHMNNAAGTANDYRPPLARRWERMVTAALVIAGLAILTGIALLASILMGAPGLAVPLGTALVALTQTELILMLVAMATVRHRPPRSRAERKAVDPPTRLAVLLWLLMIPLMILGGLADGSWWPTASMLVMLPWVMAITRVSAWPERDPWEAL